MEEFPVAKSSQRRRPDGVDDNTVEALGKLSEALETVERARGYLYDFHQLVGGADIKLDEAATMFENAGHPDIAAKIRTELIGLNVLDGRWTFQVVEEFDDGYWSTFRAVEKHARDNLVQGVRHVFEAEMKEDRRTEGRVGHEPEPPH
ncbi:hypothetical protein [Hoyosella rhizosphaerae]|uniref:Uncharacterized protein n=1 Tax=Hoyosella rhizosphaerae TaxID=1755582 RepID=A0A916U2C9_9ACTN|nr:hypothetical protein [Hoyosella rhizosphaerae]GGC56641.1 hypothetical protein GCM10011410_06380 [Hoyosella rhizosphaerae]